MEFRDYYQTLGISKTATDKEIKQAFRKLARKHHPDVNPGDRGAEARFKEINEAYEVLGDADKRRKYDELGANWRLYEQAQQSGTGPFRPEDVGAGGPVGGRWTVNVGGPGGFRSMTEEQMHELFGEQDPFSDFFRTFFGGGGSSRRRGGGRRGRAPGRDVEHEITLSLTDAFHGVTRRVSVKHGGHARTVDVRIPPGVRDGSRVRVAGEGEPGHGGGSPGDLYLRVRVSRHPKFERKGQNLHVHVPISVTIAVLGGEAAVATLDGRSLRLKVPATTQTGQVFRLRGEGMPALGKPTNRGDLYATVEVQTPRRLTAEQRQHYEALRRLEEHEPRAAKAR